MASHRNPHRTVPQVILSADQRPSSQNGYAAGANGADGFGQGYTNAHAQYHQPQARTYTQTSGQVPVYGNGTAGGPAGGANWHQTVTPGFIHEVDTAMNDAADHERAVALALADPFESINIMLRRISSINATHMQRRTRVSAEHFELLKSLRQMVVSMLRRVSAERLHYIFQVMRQVMGQMEDNAMLNEIMELAIYDYISVTEDFLEVMNASISAHADTAVGALTRYATNRADLNLDSINLICAWAVTNPDTTAFDGLTNAPTSSQTNSETTALDAVVPEAQDVAFPDEHDAGIPEV